MGTGKGSIEMRDYHVRLHGSERHQMRTDGSGNVDIRKNGEIVFNGPVTALVGIIEDCGRLRSDLAAALKAAAGLEGISRALEQRESFIAAYRRDFEKLRAERDELAEQLIYAGHVCKAAKEEIEYLQGLQAGNEHTGAAYVDLAEENERLKKELADKQTVAAAHLKLDEDYRRLQTKFRKLQEYSLSKCRQINTDLYCLEQELAK